MLRLDVVGAVRDHGLQKRNRLLRPLTPEQLLSEREAECGLQGGILRDCGSIRGDRLRVHVPLGIQVAEIPVRLPLRVERKRFPELGDGLRVGGKVPELHRFLDELCRALLRRAAPLCRSRRRDPPEEKEGSEQNAKHPTCGS